METEIEERLERIEKLEDGTFSSFNWQTGLLFKREIINESKVYASA